MSVPTLEIDDLIWRNSEFAYRQEFSGLGLMPTGRIVVIGCVDPRVDPAIIMGLQLGEAVVIRNVGGRVTPGTMRTLALLGAIAQAGGNRPGEGWNIVVIHHTDCGITRLVDHPDALAAEFGIAADEIDPETITDPHRALAADLAVLHANPGLPRGVTVSGLLYDTDTGLLETIVPPALIGRV
jgi:carbonic anhydrase